MGAVSLARAPAAGGAFAGGTGAVGGAAGLSPPAAGAGRPGVSLRKGMSTVGTSPPQVELRSRFGAAAPAMGAAGRASGAGLCEASFLSAKGVAGFAMAGRSNDTVAFCFRGRATGAGAGGGEGTAAGGETKAGGE